MGVYVCARGVRVYVINLKQKQAFESRKPKTRNKDIKENLNWIIILLPIFQ